MATIKLTNGVLLDSSSIKNFIDTSNVIGSGVSFPYTAIYDCVVTTQTYNGYWTPVIDDVSLSSISYASNFSGLNIFYLRKGSKIAAANVSSAPINVKVYGLK